MTHSYFDKLLQRMFLELKFYLIYYLQKYLLKKFDIKIKVKPEEKKKENCTIYRYYKCLATFSWI